jgi:4-oxalocrotonate tautomerase
MPHVIVKMWPGKTDEQKQRLADEVTKALMSTLNCKAESVSVGVEEVEQQKWTDEVYTPDIIGKSGTIIRKPGYAPK